MDWHNKRVLVVGLGGTGVSLLAFFSRAGAEVAAYDAKADEARAADLRQRFGAAVFSGSLADVISSDFDVLAVSPGISVRQPEIAAFKAAGGQVLGDVQILADLLAGSGSKVIAITGANGKTTVTSLVGFLCQRCGLDTVVAGNIGTPVLEAWLAREGKPADVWVLELSSFQLETTPWLNASAATVLNISEDHLDRYDDLLDYAHAKDRIFRGQAVQVLNADDVFCRAMQRAERPVKWFSLQQPADYWLNNGVLSAGDAPLISQSALPLQGNHNAANVLVALALCEAIGLPRSELLQYVGQFEGLPHRVQKIGELGGVCFIDDSKGTNVGATCAAIEGLPEKIVLIAGGVGKGQDFSPLRAALQHKARAVVLIGVDAPAIERALAGAGIALEYAESLEQATVRAYALAEAGDIVLLSPACASFDMFNGYAHRAQVFIDAFHALK